MEAGVMPQECDAHELMLDGCMCPCGCGEREHLAMLNDGVAEAIETLEAWAQWWLDSDLLLWPSACDGLALEALREGHRRRCRNGSADAIQGWAHLEAAAILRDGWRP